MAEEVCPECGCDIEDDAFEMGGVLYCCEPCANGSECECGCVEEPEEECP